MVIIMTNNSQYIDITNFIDWLRTWFDDIYEFKTPPCSDIVITSDKNLLSYHSSDSCTITAQLLDENGLECSSDISVQLFKNNILWDTLLTDEYGQVRKTYNSAGIGDVEISARVGSFVSEIFTIEDCLFVPKLDGTDSITSWTNMTNKTENGEFYSHGSFLTDGWSNDGLWELNYDVKCSSWRYVGTMPLCSAEINPYTDAKNVNYSYVTWEGLTYGYGLGYSVVSQDPLTKITNTNWHHYTITKLSSTQIKIVIDSTYTAIMNVPNIANISTLHIGSRDNPSSRNSGGIVEYKNIIVKPITE